MKRNQRESKHKLRRESKRLLDDTVAELRESDESMQDMLRREVRKVAMNRIEKSARTQADWDKILNLWDLFEDNHRKWEEDYIVPLYTLKTDNETGEIDEVDEVVCKSETVFPIPYSQTLRTRYWRHVLSGDFLDFMCDCAYSMHQSITDRDIANAVNQLTDVQKEIVYSLAIEGKSPQQVARYRNCTDRNVNKIYSAAIRSIHRYLKKVIQ